MIGCAVAIGWVVRLAWSARHGWAVGAGAEPRNAAIGFARNGYLSGVFHPLPDLARDAMPTAHLLPIPATVAGLTYRAFGIDTFTSLTVLSVFAITLTLASFVLWYLAFGAIGMARTPRIIVLTALMASPLNLDLEVVHSRFWELGYATSLSALLLLVLVRLDRRAVPGTLELAGCALLNGLLFFISPQLGIAGYACLALLAWRKIPYRRWPVALALAIVGLAVFLGPWTLRNERLLGTPIVLRSNLGLELAAGFNDRALRSDDEQAYLGRLREIHPQSSLPAYRRMLAAGGEVPYAVQLGRETKRWIRAHPASAFRLAVRHVVEFVVPPLWLWYLFDKPDPVQAFAKWLTFASVALLGLAGAVVAAWRLDPAYRYAALLLLLPIPSYALVQPTLRYHYITFALSAYLAALFVDWLRNAARARRISLTPDRRTAARGSRGRTAA